MGYVWRLKRGAGILGGARNVTAHSLTGRCRRRCVSHATRTTRSVLSRLPLRALRRAHTRLRLPRDLSEIRVNSAPSAILSPYPPRSKFHPSLCPSGGVSERLCGSSVFTRVFVRWYMRELTRDLSLAESVRNLLISIVLLVRCPKNVSCTCAKYFWETYHVQSPSTPTLTPTPVGDFLVFFCDPFTRRWVIVKNQLIV